VVLDDIHDVTAAGTHAEVQLAVQADILLGTLLIGSADDVEFGKVGILGFVLDTAQADGLGLEEADAREGPAGAAARLVLDGGDGVGLGRREGILRQRRTRTLLGKGGDAQAQKGGCQNGESFHDRLD
jgi:hypothetical protein